VIEAEKATYPIKRMSEMLEVSRSGYYKWRKSRGGGPTRPPGAAPSWTPRSPISTRPLTAFTGAPRILADLCADGERVSRNTVAAPLRRRGLAGIRPRRFAPATPVIDLDACYPKTWWGAVSTPGCSTGCGPPISLIRAPARVGCICARCAMAAHGG
jgi:putative transposase